MKLNAGVTRAVAAVTAACVVAVAPSASAQMGLERKVLLQKELTIPGQEALLMEVTIAVGGREGRYWHAGTLVGYILEGDNGSVPVKAFVTFIVEKGKPLSTPAP